jgi:hypothetical protein
MLALAVSSGLSLYLFTVCGFFIAKVANLPANVAEKALIGLAAINTITTIASLFLPINLATVAVLAVCTLPLLYVSRNDVGQLFTSGDTGKTTLMWSLPFILIAMIVSLGPPRPYDTGLYHLQTIKWIEEYAVVPGLANLHGRFGFNPNIFTFYAATSLADIFRQEIFSVNFTIYLILVMHFIHKIHSLFRQKGITNILLFNLIIFIDILFSIQNLSSPSPNFITAVLPFFILSSIADRDEKAGLKRYVPIIILCAYVLTVKLAMLPLMLLALLIIFRHRTERRTISWLCVGVAVIMVPWLVRNIILTGWLVYPFPSLDLFSFDWKVPAANVIEEKMHVTGWARRPGELHLAAAQMKMVEWFPLWWQRIFIEHKILFTLALVAPLTALVSRRITTGRAGYYAWAVTGTSFIGVLFWLLLAPAMQFGEPFLVTAALSPLLVWDFTVPKQKWGSSRVMAALYLTVLILVAIQAKKITRFDLNQIFFRPQLIKTPQEVGYKASITGGVQIYVPTSGDRCYDHVIPCTPYPDSTVVLRSTTLQSGFRHAF